MRLTDEANYEVIRLPKDKNANRSIAVNKKAFHDYFVEETYEAGIELTGTEVKSLREGKANIKEAWCAIENGELFFVSRIDNMVKINGNRVELDEIDLLIRSEYGVPTASVVHNGFIHTFVEDNSRIDGAKVRDFLEGRLPVYALPRTIRLIDKIPQTANQKYDRRALFELIKDC